MQISSQATVVLVASKHCTIDVLFMRLINMTLKRDDKLFTMLMHPLTSSRHLFHYFVGKK